MTVDHGPAPTALLRRREGVVAQVADDEAILLDIESGSYFALNSVGGRIWELCDGKRSVVELVTVICDEFDVPADTAKADTLEILEELKKEKLVVEE